MKNTKITKIALLVLSVALLVGAAIGFSVSAEETAKEYEILAKNVVYGDKTAVAVAVNATIEEANNETVKVAYYWAEDGAASWEKATLLNTNVANNLYEGKPTFAAAGVAAKNLGDVLYLTTYTGDAPANDANWISYSPAEYFYSRLYKDGFINKTEADGIDYNKRLMYEAQLQLSANAQVVLNHKADQLVSDCTMAYTNVSDITINDGKYAFASSGEAITVSIVYHGTAEYTGFQIGRRIIAKSQASNVTIDGLCEVTLYTDEISQNLFNFENVVTDTDTFHFATYTSIERANPLVQTQIGSEHDYQSSSAYYGALANLVTDPANSANRVLKVVVNNGNQNSNTKTGVGEQSLKLVARDLEANGTIHIVEYDLYVERLNKAGVRNFIRLQANGTKSDGTVASAILQGGGSDNQYNAHNKTLAAVTGTEVVANAFQVGVGTTQSEGANYALLDSHTWYRLRYVYDFTAATMRVDVSVDGGENWYLACKAQSSSMLSSAGIESISSIDLQFNCYGLGGIYYVDNVDYTVVATVPSVGASFTDAVEHPAE